MSDAPEDPEDRVVYQTTTTTDKKGNKSTTSTGNRFALSAGPPQKYYTRSFEKVHTHVDGKTTVENTTITYERSGFVDPNSGYKSPQGQNLERNVRTDWEKPAWVKAGLRPTGLQSDKKLEKPITDMNKKSGRMNIVIER